MRKRNRWIMLVLGILLGGAIAWVVWRAWPSPTHKLLERATKVADVQDNLSYWWLSSDELLVMHTDIYPKPRIPWSGYLDLMDTRTGTRTRLKGLTAVIMRHNHYAFNGPMSFQRSEDGQWLLWDRLDERDGRIYAVTAHPDGSDYREWSTATYFEASWLDNHRLSIRITTEQAQYLVVHDVTQVQPDRTLPYTSPEARALEVLTQRNDPFYLYRHEPRLHADPVPGKGPGVVFEISMRPADVPPNTPRKKIDTITFPTGENNAFHLANPQMTRLMFEVSTTDIPAYAALLHRLIPSYSYPTKPVERLYIYRPDKKELYEVGRVDNSHDDFVFCNWLPDGKRISFCYKNAVYTVPVD